MKGIAVAILVASGTAAASPITLHAPSHAVVDHVDLALHPDAKKTDALLYLSLSTEETRVTGSLTFTLPHGARVVAMSFRNSDGLRSIAKAMAPGVAERALLERVRPMKDPALLEQVKTARGEDTYSLRVFPLSPDAGALVEIAIELPAKVDATASAVAGVDDARVSVATWEDGWTLDMASSLVDRKTALYADDPHPMTHRIDVRLVPDDEADSLSATIRGRVRSHLNSLGDCFADESANVGALDLQLVIVPGGRVSSVSVAGAAKTTTDCIRKRIAEVSFSKAPDEVTVVSYPVFWLRT